MDFIAHFTMGTGGHYITMLPADWSVSTSHDPLPSSCHSKKMLWNPSIHCNGSANACGFSPGLKLQGAQCVRNVLSLTATILTDLPLTALQWVRVNSTQMQTVAQGKVSQAHRGHMSKALSWLRATQQALGSLCPVPMLCL